VKLEVLVGQSVVT